MPRIRMVWNSIPMQLAKENKKFFFGKIKEGARAKDFEVSIEWLKDCGLINKVYKVNKPSMPLKAYIDFSSFKIYLLDVGLLGALSELNAESILEGNNIIPVEVKAEENLKAQSLKVYCEKFKPDMAVRTSMSDYREQDWLVNIPLYCISRL